MEYNFLGNSGMQVSALSFGTMTFGGGQDFFQHIGNQQVEEAKRLIDICLEAGVNLFDTADMYSNGKSEEILGATLGKERREKVLIATKAFYRMGPLTHDVGLSRMHLIKACEASLKRLNTDYIDLYQVHNFDSFTPLEETLSALDLLIKQGKIRYAGCSNYSGWQLMKALSVSDKHLYQRYISQQVYYSLAARELENELLPLSLDQKIGILVWSPLSFGLLSGKFRKGGKPAEGRLAHMEAPGKIDWEKLYQTVDVLEEIAKAKEKTIPQIALRWLMQRPGISSSIIGARTEKQLRENLGATGWKLTHDEMDKLNKVSETPEIYPHWHQHLWGEDRNPPL